MHPPPPPSRSHNHPPLRPRWLGTALLPPSPPHPRTNGRRPARWLAARPRSPRELRVLQCARGRRGAWSLCFSLSFPPFPSARSAADAAMASGRCFQARRAEGAVVVGGSSSPCGCGGRGRVGERHEAQVEKAAAMLGGRRGTFPLIIPPHSSRLPPAARSLPTERGRGATPPLMAPWPRPLPKEPLVTLSGSRPFMAGAGLCGHAPRVVMGQQPLGVTSWGAEWDLGTPARDWAPLACETTLWVVPHPTV